MNIRTDILLRVYIAFGLIVFLALAVLYKLLHIQMVEGDTWKAMANSMSTRYVSIEAVRGSIYTADGNLLATSVPEYELRMDLLAAGIEKNEVFYEKVDSLSAALSGFFKDKTPLQYSKMLREARRDGARYMLLKRSVSREQLKRVKAFPIFNLGRYKGGLIVTQTNKRVLPFGSLASRTIGYKNKNVQPVGLEGAYQRYLDGENGKQLMQRIAGGVWVPVNRDMEISPKDGQDIISTIDINLQDLTHHALQEQLIKSDADHGCAILMEVATGKIKAMVNLTRVAKGSYEERFNYAIAESSEPGSTFKLVSYLVALDQGKIDTSTKVDCQGGAFRVHNHTIRDSHQGNGVISVKRAFEISSNVAVAKLIYQQYKDHPENFTKKLFELGLHDKLGLQIPGEQAPLIKNPKTSKMWSNLSLPQMAYGYELKMTPLQLLVVYNAIANGGKMIAPVLVSEIRHFGKTLEAFQARVICKEVCTKKTLKKLQAMLEGVVERGSGQTAKSFLYKVAGKTGTAQIAEGASGYGFKKSYQASFCGYFPADDPKYSMIVVLTKPRGAYYAASVAVPVFKEVTDKVYASDFEIQKSINQDIKMANMQVPLFKGGDTKSAQYVCKALGVNLSYKRMERNVACDNKQHVSKDIPDVRGMGAKDALYILADAGLEPIMKGKGMVIRQSLPPGEPVESKSITIELE